MIYEEYSSAKIGPIDRMNDAYLMIVIPCNCKLLIS
jgi:hypothetical protein